jgi:hypothetical protein
MQMTTSELQKVWMVDYGPARDRAIGWLGQRYLLATPVNRVPETDVPASGRSSRNRPQATVVSSSSSSVDG